MLKTLLLVFAILVVAYCRSQKVDVYTITFPAFVASKDMDANVVEIDSSRLLTQHDTLVSAISGVEFLSYSCIFSTKGEIFKWSAFNGLGSLQTRGFIGRTPGTLFIIIERIRFKGSVRNVEWTYKVKYR